MTHNFKISQKRLSNNPLKLYWECVFCDSGLLIPKGYTQHQVNAFAEEKFPCLPPIDKPQDVIIDDRTTIVTKPIIIDPRKRN